MTASNTRLALLLGLAGALVAALLGLLTFGAQATARPEHVPLAVSAPASPRLAQAAQRIAGLGGDVVSWRVTDQQGGRNLLADKQVYGVLELRQSPTGALTTTVVLSGAVNPTATQLAQQVLTGAAQAFGAAAAGDGMTATAPQTLTLHPASIAGRTAPLAASALLWIAGLAATALFTVLSSRKGARPGTGTRVLLAASATVAGVAVVAGLLRLWDADLPLTGAVLGFLALTAAAFAAVQGALLRWLGIRAMAVLGPLYLIAPAVAGQTPELLDPVYRALLWSWTPFRFSTEGLRSLLQGSGSAPDVRTAVVVLAAMALAGLAALCLPLPAAHRARSTGLVLGRQVSRQVSQQGS